MKTTRMTTIMLTTAAVVLMHAAAWAQSWEEIGRAAEEAGLAGRRTAGLLERCRKNGMSPADAQGILAPIQDAAKSGVPANLLVEKALEGVTKGVAPQTVESAVRKRAGCIQQAQALTRTRTQRQERRRERTALEEAVALALESGVPTETVQSVLESGVNKTSRQLSWVIAAGESLALSGFEPAEIQTLMTDCLERDLRHSETLRAVQYSCARRRDGMRFREMRRALWGGGSFGPGHGTAGGPGGRETGPGPNREVFVEGAGGAAPDPRGDPGGSGGPALGAGDSGPQYGRSRRPSQPGNAPATPGRAE